MSNHVYNIGDRVFTLSPLTPRVMTRIVQAAKEILDVLPKDVMLKIENKDLSKASPLELLEALGVFAMENQTRLIACVLCQEGIKDAEKNVLEIAEYLEDNLRLTTELRVIHDFFVSEDIKSAVVLIRETIKSAKSKLSEKTPSGNG